MFLLTCSSSALSFLTLALRPISSPFSFSISSKNLKKKKNTHNYTKQLVQQKILIIRNQKGKWLHLFYVPWLAFGLYPTLIFVLFGNNEGLVQCSFLWSS
ncbi:hypothetical protein HanIR_Chr17g0878741 [Helianthus annuus]|nr:hypothetical protein HanIR_Chr17g0878741 [Helianthus annuus]